MRWSVSVMAEGDRLVELSEVVELADAVAANDGIATGMGTPAYGAQIVVEAETSDHALELAITLFTAAAGKAGLPSWPITQVETIREDEELDYVWEDVSGTGLEDGPE